MKIQLIIYLNLGILLLIKKYSKEVIINAKGWNIRPADSINKCIITLSVENRLAKRIKGMAD